MLNTCLYMYLILNILCVALEELGSAVVYAGAKFRVPNIMSFQSKVKIVFKY